MPCGPRLGLPLPPPPFLDFYGMPGGLDGNYRKVKFNIFKIEKLIKNTIIDSSRICKNTLKHSFFREQSFLQTFLKSPVVKGEAGFHSDRVATAYGSVL